MKHDGGPAFPGASEKELGLTVRDYFAAAALTELDNPDSVFAPTREQTALGMTWADVLAQNCYKVADAMLAERLK
jgi:hypothetical protein